MLPMIKEQRKKPQCSLCSNHEKFVDKSGHRPKDCKYEKDHPCESSSCENPVRPHPCELCATTKIRRACGIAEIKRKRKLDETRTEESEDPDRPLNKMRKQQECRYCRNHKIFVRKSGTHKITCEHKNCQCKLCVETDELQKSVVLLQKAVVLLQNCLEDKLERLSLSPKLDNILLCQNLYH